MSHLKAAAPRRKSVLFKLFLCGAAMLLTMLPGEKSFAEGRAFHAKLANGLEVIVLPDHRAPVVTHMLWYRVGSADEPAGKSGIAHFLEHLMFKGTKEIAPGDFSKIIARNGGRDNAFTSHDITAYYQRVAKDRLPVVMRMEADRMANLMLDEENVKTELKVILEERRMRVDNDPQSILSEQINAAQYLAHPYRIPIIGWENEIRGLTREDALAFYKHFYAPNNAILVVAGDVEGAEIMPLAEEIFGKLAPNPSIKPRMRTKEPEQPAERRLILKDERAGKATLQRQYLAPGATAGAPREAEALELLAKIVGSSNTSRLYTKLVVEKKIAASATGWYEGASLDGGTIGFYAVAAENVKLEDVEQAMDQVLAEVRENGVTTEELERARNAAIADIVYGSDNQVAMANHYGWSMATGQTVEDVEARPKRLAAVTLDDVKAVALKYLDIRRSVTGQLIPVPSQTASAAPVRPFQPGTMIH
jgi:zinc protease